MKRIKIFILILFFLFIAFAFLFVGPTFSPDRNVLFYIRFPRIFQAMIVGASLAVSGVIFQGVLKNPLCDPYILGTSAGALAGVVLADIIGISYLSVFFYMIIIVCAFGATLLSYTIASINKYPSNATILLAGIAVSAFLSALVLLFLNINQENLLNIYVFVMGGLYQTDIKLLLVAFLLCVSGIILCIFLSRYLDIFSIGEEKTQHLGIEIKKLKLIFFAIASIITGCAVSISGIIGFVGLIVPHICRLIFGASHRRLLIASGFTGAVFLIVADGLARTIASPSEIPVGIITAFVGAPFFLYLLNKKRKEIQ